MKKFNVKTGISAALLALSLVVTAIPANAAKLDATQMEMTKVGGPTVSAPTITLKDTVGSGQVNTKWRFTYSAVPADVKDADGYTVGSYTLSYLVFDQSDRTKPEKGSYITDIFGKKVVNGYGNFNYVDANENPDYKYEFTISGLKPGKKEVVAYLFDGPAYNNDRNAARKAADEAYDKAWDAAPADAKPDREDYYLPDENGNYTYGISKADYYVASAPVAIEVSMETPIYTTVTATSIQLDMLSDATGYEIYRQAGKKYVKIATVASNVYMDKGLDSKTTYAYKVRPYYVNRESGEVTYGKDTTIEATTKGSALNLKTKITSKNKVELSWQKVTGATKYEIYRNDTSSAASSISKDSNNGYSTLKLIATVKKNKKKYTDKTVSLNRNYHYEVRAILPKDKKVKSDKNHVISEGTSASFRFGTIAPVSQYKNAKGDLTVTWKKVYDATGYIVEVCAYDATKDKWTWQTAQSLGKDQTTATLPAQATLDKDGKVKTTKTYYRIKAYNGTKYDDEYSETDGRYLYAGGNYFETELALGVVGKVTAKATENGINVSWSAVPGAAYYEVYRVPADRLVKNNNIGGYSFDPDNYNAITEYVGVTAPVAVDVAAWNAAVDADIAKQKTDYTAWLADTTPDKAPFDDSKYLKRRDKLSDKSTYHYQNYSYARSIFDANTLSMTDYSGEIYSGGYGSYSVEEATVAAGKATATKWKAEYYNPCVNDANVKKVGPQAGVDYMYYVVAYEAKAYDASDYADYTWEKYTDKAAYDADYAAWDKEYKAMQEAYNKALDAYHDDPSNNPYPDYPDYPQRPYQWDDKYQVPYGPEYYLTRGSTVVPYNTTVTGPKADKSAYAGTPVAVPNIKETYSNTVGVGAVGTATFTAKDAPKGKVKIKSVKCSKKTATIKFKKAAGADGYKIYRATKKKGKYYSVGVTTKTSFKDAGLTAKQTYYYKVVPFTVNEANAEVEGKASAVKKVKAK